MTSKKNTGVTIINLEEFDKLEAEDNFTLECLIVKVKESGYIQSLPDWIANYPIPPGTRPCRWTVAQCMREIIIRQKKEAISIHPIHQIELVTSTNNVVVGVEGINYTEGEKKHSMGVNFAYLVPSLGDSLRVIHASTSELIAVDAKYDKKGGVNVPEWPANFKVPVTDSVNAREVLKNTTPSRSVARDQLFSTFVNPQNSVQAIRIHSAIGKNLPNFTEHGMMTKALVNYYDKHGLKKPSDLVAKIINVDSGEVPYTNNIDVAYKYYFKSTSIRGGRDGSGLAHGFERFSMSRTMANTLNLLQDFYNMAELYGSKTVIIRDSGYLSSEEMRVLVHNGFRIIFLNSSYPKCFKDSAPGVYSDVAKKIPVFEFMSVGEENVRPIMEKKVITLGNLYPEALAKVSRKERTFAYMYLDKRLASYVKQLSMLPSATADTLKIIVATGVNKTFSIEGLTKRATMAVSCRNRFLHARKPFFTMDIMADFVKWRRPLFYPRLREMKEEKFIDLTHIEVGNLDTKLEPLNVTESHFTTITEQIESVAITMESLVQECLDRDPSYMIRVYYGNLKDSANKFAFVQDKGRSWDSKFDPIFTLKDSEFKNFMVRFGRQTDALEIEAAIFIDEDEEDDKGREEPDDNDGKAIDFDLSEFANIDLSIR